MHPRSSCSASRILPRWQITGQRVVRKQQPEIDGRFLRGVLQAERDLRITKPLTACGTVTHGAIPASPSPQIFFNICPQLAADTLEVSRNTRFMLAAQPP